MYPPFFPAKKGTILFFFFMRSAVRSRSPPMVEFPSFRISLTPFICQKRPCFLYITHPPPPTTPPPPPPHNTKQPTPPTKIKSTSFAAPPLGPARTLVARMRPLHDVCKHLADLVLSKISRRALEGCVDFLCFLYFLRGADCTSDRSDARLCGKPRFLLSNYLRDGVILCPPQC